MTTLAAQPAVGAQAPDPQPENGAAIGRARALGASIHVRNEASTRWLVWLCAAIIAGIVLALTFGHFSRSEAVSGYMSSVSGITRLSAQANGVVRQVHVRQGQRVVVGQRLMTIAVRDVSSNGVSTIQASLASLQQRRANAVENRRQAQAFLDGAGQDRGQIAGTLTQMTKEIEQQERDLQNALARQQDLVKKARQYLSAGYATRDTVAAQERGALEYSRLLSETRIKKVDLRQQTNERGRAQGGLVLERQSQIATLDSEIAALDAMIAQTRGLDQQDIVAPVAGQVSSLLAETGASVAAEQVLAIVADVEADPLIVLEVPSRAIGVTKVGQRVVIKYDAFPFKTFGVSHGVITAIANSPVRSPGSASEKDGLADPRPAAAAVVGRQSVFRIEVKPDKRTISAYGREEPIALGSTLSADIVVERRRLIDWVLDPITAVRGRT